MNSDPLQQLRDVHVPMEPGWWPPAFGWWLLAAMAIGGIAWLVLLGIGEYKKRQPIRRARILIDQSYRAVEAGQLAPIEFLHAGNEILKRTLVPGLGHAEYAKLAGRDWLVALDEITETHRFTDGPGQILGNDRFRREPQVDADVLYSDLKLVLAKVAP